MYDQPGRYQVDRGRFEKLPLFELGEELLYLQKYIELQKTRYGERLSTMVEYDQSLIDLKVPAFLLQPIIENSIKHGIEKNGNPVQVQIKIKIQDDQLLFNCKDSNQTTFKCLNESKGTGLNNLTLRLKNLYGDLAEIKSSIMQDGFNTLISIPLNK